MERCCVLYLLVILSCAWIVRTCPLKFTYNSNKNEEQNGNDAHDGDYKKNDGVHFDLNIDDKLKNESNSIYLADGCKEDEFFNSSKDCYLFIDEEKNWNDANEYCTKYNAGMPSDFEFISDVDINDGATSECPTNLQKERWLRMFYRHPWPADSRYEGLNSTESHCGIKTFYGYNNATTSFVPCKERRKFVCVRYGVGYKPGGAAFCRPISIPYSNSTIWFESTGQEGDVTNSTSVCLNKDLTPLAQGTCEGNNDIGYSWNITSYNKCLPDKNITSAVTIELRNILNGIGSIISQIDHVANLTAASSKEMSHIDVNLVASFVEAVANNTEYIDELDGKGLVGIVSNAMEAPLDVPLKSAADQKRVAESKLRLINSLETVASKVQLSTSNVTWTTNQFSLHIDESTASEKSFGMRMNVDGGNGTDTDVSDDVTIVVPEKTYLELETQNRERQQNARTIFIAYNSESFFNDPNCQDGEEKNSRIISSVISGSIAGIKVENLIDKVKLRFKLREETINPSCVFVAKSDSTWRWSKRGLTRESYDNQTGIVECSSDHMTNFAVLTGIYTDTSARASKALTYISITGTMLSTISLSLAILSQLFVKKSRNRQYQLAILNLSIALIAVNLLVLIGIDRTNNRVGCMVVAALLHYFLLVAFSWMLIEAVLQYYKFVKMYNVLIRKFVIKTVLPAWTLPAVVVSVTACIDYNQFRGPKNYCWLAKDAFHFAFLLPLGLIVLTNIFIFIRIIKGISCDRPKIIRKNQTRLQLIVLQVQVGICCFVVMGLTWCFALFAFGKAALVMQFLFAIFNSLQGFFVFVLFILREKPVRKAWYELLCKRNLKQKCVPSVNPKTLQQIEQVEWKHKSGLPISEISKPIVAYSTNVTVSDNDILN